MFHDEFYPTPPDVARKMLQPYWGLQRKDLRILDPSAGSGNLLDAAIGLLGASNRNPRMYAVEITPELQSVLRGKGYSVVGDDFLKFTPDEDYDLILMNPPFSNGDAHLLHAWDILHDGNICCLLNAETLRNPYTERRQMLLRLIEEHGSWEDIGPVFRTADRKTNVDIALVRLSKKAPTDRFKFTSTGRDTDGVEFDERGTIAVRNDQIGNLVHYYEGAKNAFKKFLLAKQELEFYTKPLAAGRTISEWLGEVKYGDTTPSKQFTLYLHMLNKAAWSSVFEQTKLEDVATERVRNEFRKFRDQQGLMAFTEENIRNLILSIMADSQNIAKQCVVDAFDLLCSYHEKNKVHVEGWKTNSFYKVNKKVILPRMIEVKKYGAYTSISLDHYMFYSRSISDVDKALCMLTGQKFTEIRTIHKAVREAIDAGRWECESTFFQITLFKKGTGHMVFKDADLLARFNHAAAEGKNWLGGKV